MPEGLGKPAPLRDRTIAASTLTQEELFELVYDELHGLARRNMNGQSPGHTLQPTALVNEVYLKLAKGDDRIWGSREHFLNSAAKAMRHVLVDHARRKGSGKRKSAGDRVALDEVLVQFDERSMDIVALDDGLEALAQQEPELVQIVELHFFGGCTFEEIARTLNAPLRSVQRDWKFARAWLHRRLKDGMDE